MGLRFLAAQDVIAVLGFRGFEFWNAESGVMENRLELPPDVRASAWSVPAVGDLLALGVLNDGIRVLDHSSGTEVARLSLPQDAEAYLSAESPGLATFGAIHHPDGTYEDRSRRYPPYHSSCSVAFSPDATTLVAAYGQAYALVWDLTTSTLLGIIGQDVAAEVPPRIYRVAWSPDGALIATADNLGRVRLWDATSGDEQLAIRGQRPVSPDQGDRPADMPGEVSLVGGVEPVAFTSDSRGIVGAGPHGVDVWSTSTGRTTGSWRGHLPVHPIMGTYQGAPRILDIRISQSGHRALTVGIDATLRVWNVHTGQELWHIQPAVCCVDWADLNNDGSQIAWVGCPGMRLYALSPDL